MTRSLSRFVALGCLYLASAVGCGGESETCGDGLCEANEIGACTTDCGMPSDGGVACEHRGVRYPAGVTFPAGDGCNTCSCETSGSVSCTEAVCNEGCVYNGVSYEVGATFSVACNTCTCGTDGLVNCTTAVCDEGCRNHADCDNGSGICAAPGEATGGCGIPCPLAMCNEGSPCTQDGEVCHHGRFSPYQTCCDDPTPAWGVCAPECADNQSCDAGQRCGESRACEPIPCADGYACAEGTTCDGTDSAADAHGCAPVRCDAGYTCPNHTDCDLSASDADAHGCVRRRCSGDLECSGGGYCVKGSCYATLGTCAILAP